MAKRELKGLTDKYWITDFNYLDDVRKQFTLPENVHIHDVTLREAEQTPHVVLLPDEKMRLFEALDELGVYSVELLPLISAQDRALGKELVKKKRKAKIFYLTRWVEKEVDVALEDGVDGIVMECPGFPFIGKTVWDLDEQGMIDKLVKAAKYAKKNGMFTTVMPWDDFKAPIEFLERLYKSVVQEAGVDHVVLADTFGFGLPWTTAYFVRKMKEWIPGIPIEWHCHNDFGLATAEMLSAVVGGASTVHTALNTLGERAGNASTEEVVMGLELLLGVDTGVNLDKIYPACTLASQLSKIPIPLNKAIIGDNEFTYESGMVVDMMLKAAKTDRPFATMAFSPGLIGRKGFKTILGKGSGGTIIRDRLAKLGLEASKEQVAKMVEMVKKEAMVRKWSITEDDFELIAKKVLQGE